MSFLQIQNLSASYGTRQILDDISFSAEKGALTGLLGANGCGKTTLIKSVCGLLRHSGSCTLDGQVLESLSEKQLARLCSYIPQRSGISIDLTLMDVVLMGFNPHLGLLDRANSAMKKQALNALRTVDLEARANESYLTLSEGQKQLCILARTLVSDGKLLLLDEPESALDFQRRYEMLRLIRSWLGSERCALVALHDPQLALNHCDQLLLMCGGRIKHVIHPSRDALSDMEDALKTIYGPVTLVRCQDKSGCDHLVMLREGGDA